MPRPSWARYTSAPRPSAAIWRIASCSCGAAVAAQRPEDLAGGARGVHAHEHVGDAGDIPVDQREVLPAVHQRAVAVQAKDAELGGQACAGDALDEASRAWRRWAISSATVIILRPWRRA